MKEHYENSELGKIFRSKLDAHEVPYNPAHWHALRAKMQAAPQPLAAGWRYAALLLLGTSLVASLWWLTQETTPVVADKTPATKPTATAPTTEIRHSQSPAISEQPATSVTADHTTTASSMHNTSTTSLEAAHSDTDVLTKNTVQKTTSPTSALPPNPTAVETKKGVFAPEGKSAIALSKSAQQPSTIHTTTATPSVATVPDYMAGLSPMAFIAFQDTLNAKGKLLSLQQLPASLPAPTQLPKNNLFNLGNVRIGLVALPYMQWAKVYQAYNQQFEATQRKVVGLQGGLQVGLALNNWLSVETGVWANSYTISNFYAQALPFKPLYSDSLAARYLFEGNTKEVLHYQQTSLLLPIALRADVLTHGQHRVFLKGTVLNQFIVNETSLYELSYSQIYIFPSVQLEKRAFMQGEFSRTAQMNWASAVQLQVGYERQLTTHWGIQVEPFLRIPLKTEGMNQLSNYSTGVALQLNYGF